MELFRETKRIPTGGKVNSRDRGTARGRRETDAAIRFKSGLLNGPMLTAANSIRSCLCTDR